jgi:RNA recognition motif-containing protein
MTRKKNKVRAGNNNSSNAQQAKARLFTQPSQYHARLTPHHQSIPRAPTPPKPRAQPNRTIALHNVPPTTSFDDISKLIPTISITEHKRSVDAETLEPSRIVLLLFGTKEDAVRAYFGLDGEMLGGEVVRANWVNGVLFVSEYK